MIGLDPATGRVRQGPDWLKAAVADVLTTPVGSRIMRRDYGSRLFELIDQPIHPETLPIRLYAATAMALRRWLSTVYRLARVLLRVDPARPGVATLQLDGFDLTGPAPSPLSFELPIALRPAVAA